MSYFQNFMKANKAYVDLHGDYHLPLRPKTKVAIVTCMDSRLHVAQALGLALGDAHILRNAGGRVTEDMIRSLVISSSSSAQGKSWCSTIQTAVPRPLPTRILRSNSSGIWEWMWLVRTFFLYRH